MVGSSRTSLLSACLLSLLAACASSTTYRSVQDLSAEERERLMVRPEDAAQGRDCTVNLEPAPSFAELVDSAGIHAELVRQWPNVGNSVEVAGHAVLTVDVDSTGDVSWIDVHSSDLPDTAVTFLSGLLPGRVKTRVRDSEEGPRREGWMFRIGFGVGGAPAFSVSRPVYCTPRLQNEEEVRAKFSDLVNLYDLDDARGPRRTTVLWILPGADGRPQRVEVNRSSGSSALDQAARTAVADGVFDRATADGHPLEEVWASIPFYLTQQPQRQGR